MWDSLNIITVNNNVWEAVVGGNDINIPTKEGSVEKNPMLYGQ